MKIGAAGYVSDADAGAARMLNLARKRADGDRSIRDVRKAAACIGRHRPPECLALALRKPSWPAVMCDRLDEAGHMTASDPIIGAQDLAGRRPSTYACWC